MRFILTACIAMLWGCHTPQGTPAPPEGWANTAPTRVEHVVDQGDSQLLDVRQGGARAWVRLPHEDALPGDYVLLGSGRLETDVVLPQAGEVPELVHIEHIQVVDKATAEEAVRAMAPIDAVAISDVYRDLDALADDEVTIYGTVVKVPNAVGWNWVHLQDGSGHSENGNHDLTVRTQRSVVVGQRVAFTGTVRKDVDLGFGYHYHALIEDGVH